MNKEFIKHAILTDPVTLDYAVNLVMAKLMPSNSLVSQAAKWVEDHYRENRNSLLSIKELREEAFKQG